MTRGKRTCKILKEIRQQIAEKNDIEYITSECHFQGECEGTCPKCEAELKYIENELQKRRQLGKTAAIAGISLGIAGTFSACNTPQKTNSAMPEQEIATDTVSLDTIPADTYEKTAIPSKRTSKHSVSYVIDTTPILLNEFVKEESRIDIMSMEVGRIAREMEPVHFAEEMCEFPNGMDSLYKYLKEKLIYPNLPEQKKIKGTVKVEFVVTRYGKVSDVKVIVPLHPDYDREVIRVLQEMPVWKPAKEKGYPIPVYYNLSIKIPLKKKSQVKYQKPIL
jgi:TonB family protein